MSDLVSGLVCESESESRMDQRVSESTDVFGSGCMEYEGVCEWMTEQMCEQEWES